MTENSTYSPLCDYSKILDKTLRDILIAGEAEWLENAPETYGSDAINVWEEEVFPRILTNSLREIDYEDLELYCTTLLTNLREYFF